jgi:hypothetical protein
VKNTIERDGWSLLGTYRNKTSLTLGASHNRKLGYRDSVSWRRRGPDHSGKGLIALVAAEREAISLASKVQAILLLMDERDGVTIARHRRMKVVGTLAALDLAAAHGLVDLQTMLDRLRAPAFRSPRRLMASTLEQDAERMKRQRDRQ